MSNLVIDSPFPSPVMAAVNGNSAIASAPAGGNGTPAMIGNPAAFGFITWQANVFGRLNRRFEQGPAEDLLRWAIDTFGTGLSLSTGLGASGIVLMDLALKLQPDLDVFYIDTGYFFPETETLIERLQNHYQRALRRVSTMVTIAEQSSLYGEKLYSSDPDLCCHIRKVAPMETALRDSTAWITALRRDQSDGRKQTPVVQWNDRYSVVKIAPLVNWTEEEIWGYVHQQGLPYNSLHDQHYPSIGCWPCTRAVRPGEDIRAGRWAGRDKSECGIHGSGTPAVLTLGSGV